MNKVLEPALPVTTGGGRGNPLMSIGILSYGAHATLESTLKSHQKVDLSALTDDLFVYFNAMTEADMQLAGRFGIRHHGSAANSGIYGGFRGIVEQARAPYVLILENDIISHGAADDARATIDSCLADMVEHGIKAFCLKSREFPGQGLQSELDKYAACFPVHDPVNQRSRRGRPSVASVVRMIAKHLGIDQFRGTAVNVEKNPEVCQPAAIRKLPSGNYLTSSRYRKWSNQAVLVDRRFFLDVVADRVERYPDKSHVNGFQDIERAVSRGIRAARWWQGLDAPMGHAGRGFFCHERLDR